MNSPFFPSILFSSFQSISVQIEYNNFIYRFIQNKRLRTWTVKNECLVSKIGLSALSRIQQRELAKDNRKDIVVNHVHPGVFLSLNEKYIF